MKEYQSKAGGRYIFNEDIENLQELAVSMASLFEDCGQDFVISGCEVTKSSNTVSISSGMVWLDGKIRRVAASSGTYQSNMELHIVAKQTDGPTIKYADGTGGKQYTEFGTQVKIGVALQDGEQAISIDNYADGKQFPNIHNAWFRHYAVTKDINGIVDLIKLLSNGCEIAGDTGNTDDFRGTYINSYSGIPANTSVSGMSLNDVPIFTYNDLMLIKKLIVQNLFVRGNAYIDELFVNNAHIPNTVRVLASAKMKASDGSTTINNMVAYVTNFELIIAGTCTAENLGASANNLISESGSLYLPANIMNLISSRFIVNSVTGSADSIKLYANEENIRGIYYQSNTDQQAGYSWTSRVAHSVTVNSEGKVIFSPMDMMVYISSNPKICVHFNLLYDSGD